MSFAHEMQNKVSEMLGYNSSEKRAGVENLMRDFYSAAYNTHNLSNTLIHRCLEYRKKNKSIINLKSLLSIVEKFFIDENIVFPKEWNVFRQIFNKKNISRKECLLLPFKTLSKALKL